MAPGSDDEPPGSGPATLAALLRGLRQRALLTQEELARRSGLSVRTIRGLELGGTRRPHSGSVRLLADALQLSGRDREALVEAARGEPARRAVPPPVAPASRPPGPVSPASRPRRGVRRLAGRVPWWAWPVALLAPLAVLVGPTVAPAPDRGDGAPAGAPARPPSELRPLPERIRAAGRIVVSSQDTLAPIVFVDPRSGRFRGLDHDLAQAMGQRLGVEFQFRKVDFTHSFRDMRAGRSDIAMSVFRDVNRAADLDYVDYLDPGTAFLVRKGNPLRIRSRDDLCGRTVARPLTTPAEALLRQSQRCVARGRAKITLMTCPTIPDPRSPVRGQMIQRRCPAPEPLRRVQELVRDRGADAAMLDLPLAQHAMTAPGAGRHLEIAPPQIDAGPYGIVFRTADRQLMDAVRSALQAIVADGTYARILAEVGPRQPGAAARRRGRRVLRAAAPTIG